MKKLIVALCLVGATVSSPALAWNNGYRGQVYYNNGYYNNGYNNNYWVAPALAGLAVGVLASRSYYAPPPVVYQQPVYIQTPVYVQTNPAPIGYTQQQILDANCNCWRTVLVPQ
jgi:hypothetical protein